MEPELVQEPKEEVMEEKAVSEEEAKVDLPLSDHSSEQELPHDPLQETVKESLAES